MSLSTPFSLDELEEGLAFAVNAAAAEPQAEASGSHLAVIAASFTAHLIAVDGTAEVRYQFAGPADRTQVQHSYSFDDVGWRLDHTSESPDD